MEELDAAKQKIEQLSVDVVKISEFLYLAIQYEFALIYMIALHK